MNHPGVSVSLFPRRGPTPFSTVAIFVSLLPCMGFPSLSTKSSLFSSVIACLPFGLPWVPIIRLALGLHCCRAQGRLKERCGGFVGAITSYKRCKTTIAVPLARQLIGSHYP